MLFKNPPSDWKTASLGEICMNKGGIQTGPFGSQLHSSDYVETGTPIITVEHLLSNRISHKNTPKVSDFDKERLSKYTLRKGDIVFSRVGSVDRRSLVRDEEIGWLFSGRCLRVRPDKLIIDPTYLSYYLGHSKIKYHIRSIAVGATMPSLNTNLLSGLEVLYPPDIKEQNIISHILGTLDEKIELNKKTNETLEEIAKALFKSWFIDFDPVKAKAEGRSTGLPDEISDLFPDSLEESEIGQIPNSWDTKKISDWGETVCGKTPSTKNESYYGNDYMFVTIPDLHKGLHITSSSKGLSKSGAELQSKKLLSKGSILVSCIATPGLIGVVQESCFTNQQINSITPNNKNCTWFIAFYLLMNKDLLLSFGGGGSVFFNLNKSKFDSIEILSPPEKIIDKFNQSVFPLMDKCFALKREISFLSNIRDALLPKLISGELRIPDAEKIIEEVGI